MLMKSNNEISRKANFIQDSRAPIYQIGVERVNTFFTKQRLNSYLEESSIMCVE